MQHSHPGNFLFVRTKPFTQKYHNFSVFQLIFNFHGNNKFPEKFLSFVRGFICYFWRFLLFVFLGKKTSIQKIAASTCKIYLFKGKSSPVVLATAATFDLFIFIISYMPKRYFCLSVFVLQNNQILSPWHSNM